MADNKTLHRSRLPRVFTWTITLRRLGECRRYRTKKPLVPMVIEANIDYFIAIAQGHSTLPFQQWWDTNAAQLERELPWTQFLRLKIHSFDEICRILDEREIEYTKSFTNSNVRATRLPMSHDPIERDPKIAPLIDEADRITQNELANEKRRMGFCHVYWQTKKRILNEQFGVDWQTPAEMNPGVMFD